MSCNTTHACFRKESDSSFELTIWQEEMGSNSIVEQMYLQPYLLDQHYEVAVTQVNLPHTWINVANKENYGILNEMERVTFNKGYYRTAADARGGGTPLYGLYRYVRPQRVWFFSCFGHK